MGAATKDGVLPVEGDQHVFFLSAIIYKLLVSHLGRFFNDTCRLWCFCNQYFLRTSGRLDGKQPGPSLLPAGYRFVLKHCSEAVGMTVKFGNAHPSDVPVKDLQMKLLLDNFPIPLKHKLT